VGSGYGSGLVIRESEFSGRVKCNAVLSVEFLENNLEITSRFCKSLRFFQIGDLPLRLKKASQFSRMSPESPDFFSIFPNWRYATSVAISSRKSPNLQFFDCYMIFFVGRVPVRDINEIGISFYFRAGSI
jgi:hypothetical protein